MANQVDPEVITLPVQQPPATESGGLATLLQFEGDLRKQATVSELGYFLVNESRRIIGFDQMFLLKGSSVSESFRVEVASSIALVDRNAPLIHAIEKSVRRFIDTNSAKHAGAMTASDYLDDASLTEYPYHFWYWQPLCDRLGRCFGGLLLTRSKPLGEGEAVRLERIAESGAHSWLALTGGKPVRRLPSLTRNKRIGIAAALLIGMLFPIRMSALAPVEVVAERAFVVSAPFAGVIDRIEVSPNSLVKAGQPVLTFEDIKVRNELQQAMERVNVARAKLERSTDAAFADASQAKDIGTLRAELDMARTDYAYASDVMRKSQIVAPRDGMVIYSDRRDWEGRAVNVGDPVMQIADPDKIAYRIDLPTKEQLKLEPGTQVKIWLDAEPLWALGATVDSASYQARPTAEGILAFAVRAKASHSDHPRIGSRGTAKLYGPYVPFAYSLLRRPISSLRQYFGI